MNHKANYSNAVLLPIEDIFDIDRAALTEAKATSDQELAEEIKGLNEKDENTLSDIDRNLEKYIISYSKNPEERKDIETIALKRLSLLQNMAKRSHPLSASGKARLREARKNREEFEAVIGPVVSAITAKNIKLFNSVIPEDIKEEILIGKSGAIGALKALNDMIYGVAAIVFDTAFENGRELTRIKWLYVDPIFRREGVANYLIGELITSLVSNKTDNIMVSFPSKNEFGTILGYIFGSWDFAFRSGITEDTVIRVNDLFREIKKIHTVKKASKSLSRLSDKERTRLLYEAARAFGSKGLLLNKALPKNYFDNELSCFIGEINDPGAILLVHKTPSGILRAEYTGYKKDALGSVLDLYAMLLEQAFRLYDEDTLVVLPCSGKLAKALEKLCPMQLGEYLVKGYLNKPNE
ncbi:MAG: hypothetical protein J6N76_06975 [Lachnospiraceae bacterium]|nr:hypothetical protein [Lachnospiraceae bacterium]